MITGLQLALAGGGLVGLGLAIALWRLAPAHPDLDDVLTRTAPQRVTYRREGPAEAGTEVLTAQERLGLWSMRHLPARLLSGVPRQELALLQIPVQQHYGRKAAQALGGLLAPPVLTLLAAALGTSVPVAFPVLGSIVLAFLLFKTPDAEVMARAKRARIEFTRALGAYVDLVALERNAGSGPRQAMEVAAGIGDSWVFLRLREELARSRWNQEAPWDALQALSVELGLPELEDFADIMRLSSEGAQVYSNLRARSASMRAAMLNDELAKANETSERLGIPRTLLGITTLALFAAPALLSIPTG